MVAAGAAALEAGSAKVSFAPDLGTPLHGKMEREGRGATSIHDPLWARALYLEDGDTQVFLVTLDLYGISEVLRERVLEFSPGVTPPEHVIVVATGTHGGPGGMDRPLALRSLSGRYLPGVVDEVAQAAGEAMQHAYNNRQPAVIGYGVTTQTVLSRSARGGPMDEQIGVIRVDNAEGTSLAIVGNFAARADTLPDELLYAMSADYPGVYYEEVERLSAAGCVAFFLNGSAGDQMAGNPENRRGWEWTESIGRLLAVRVKGVANVIDPREARLEFRYQHAALPPSLLGRALPDYTVIQTLAIGELLLTFVPGLPYAEAGLALRREALAAGYTAQMTIGLSNDALGHFPTMEAYAATVPDEPVYYGPGMAEWLLRELREILKDAEESGENQERVPAVLGRFGGVLLVDMTGSAHGRGLQRGGAFSAEYNAAVERRVRETLQDHNVKLGRLPWKWAPRFVDQTQIVAPAIAAAARPKLAGLPEAAWNELIGIANGAGSGGARLTFDFLWLAQMGPAGPPPSLYLASNEATTVAGIRLSSQETPVLLRATGETGHRYLAVSLQGRVGAICGINSAGLAVSISGDDGAEGEHAAAAQLAVSQLLAEAESMDEAANIIEGYGAYRGHIVLSHSMDGTWLRTGEGGALEAVEAGEGLHVMDGPEANVIEAVRRQLRAPGRLGAAPGLAVILEPGRGLIHVSRPDEFGVPGAYETITLEGSAP